jgi:hypothetical protein
MNLAPMIIFAVKRFDFLTYPDGFRDARLGRSAGLESVYRVGFSRSHSAGSRGIDLAHCPAEVCSSNQAILGPERRPRLHLTNRSRKISPLLSPPISGPSHCSLAYSAWASFRMGMSRSASFQRGEEIFAGGTSFGAAAEDGQNTNDRLLSFSLTNRFASRAMQRGSDQWR